MPKTPTPLPTEPQRSKQGSHTETIGDLIDGGYKIALYCENRDSVGVSCGFVKWVDLEKLACRLGRDHSCLAPDITPYMWCLKCRGRKVTLRMHPPVPGIGNAHFHG